MEFSGQGDVDSSSLTETGITGSGWPQGMLSAGLSTAMLGELTSDVVRGVLGGGESNRSEGWQIRQRSAVFSVRSVTDAPSNNLSCSWFVRANNLMT